ncbi:MAG TPA: hypothetical protein VGU22_17175 [Methylomirabilota bacterium]|jgi:hypothetical protein|nr:hypothetical protein [Methylomirabilota bacterium]
MKSIRLLVVLASTVRGSVEEIVLGLLRRLDALAPDLAGVDVDTLAVQVRSWTRRTDVARLAELMRRMRPDVVTTPCEGACA